MTWLSDSALKRLRDVADRPDLEGTKYRVIEVLGRGGMGTVWLAEDTELEREVALKVLQGPVVDPDAAERMVREARILASLEHPGIVPVHDVGRLPDGRVFYVMKLVRGSRLDEQLDLSSSLQSRLRTFERICEAVSFGHAHGVIHRDLKPENVMVGPFGEVLVLDWGVARLLPERGPGDAVAAAGRDSEGGAGRIQAGAGVLADPESTVPSKPDAPDEAQDAGEATSARTGAPDGLRAGTPSTGSRTGEPTASPAPTRDPDETLTKHTAHGTVIGTPAYMAPEQARGEVDRVDQRSDIYALGALLHALLTGRAPDGGQTPRQIRPEIPRPVEAICRKAMAAAPCERYAAVDDLRQDVARFLSGLPVSAYREGVVEQIARVASKYRTPILLVVAYLVMRVALILLQ